MIDLDSRPVSSVRNFTPTRPTLPPPTHVSWDEHSDIRRFDIQTARGPIHVAMRRKGWRLQGGPEALEAFGVIHLEWLPGRPGNGKFAQKVVFAPDGRALLGSWKGAAPKLPHISITKDSGRTFTVCMAYDSEEQAESDAFQRQRGQQESWKTAKKVHLDSDYPSIWRRQVLERISDLEGLIDGSRYFTGHPEVGIPPRDQRPILAALAEAKRWLDSSSPQLKDVMRRNNVYSLDGKVYDRRAYG